ncbi:MAG TPA: hypothetical protein VFQ45_17485 [Longimicrobium sp.]|nr:hypothetical protein [Longimicrobium sp.]
MPETAPAAPRRPTMQDHVLVALLAVVTVANFASLWSQRPNVNDMHCVVAGAALAALIMRGGMNYAPAHLRPVFKYVAFAVMGASIVYFLMNLNG